MMRDGEGRLEAASQRLMQALDTLEARLRERAEAPAANDSGSAEELRRLTSELSETRERERQLEVAAAEASAALGRAAEQIRLAVEEDA